MVYDKDHPRRDRTGPWITSHKRHPELPPVVISVDEMKAMIRQSHANLDYDFQREFLNNIMELNKLIGDLTE